MRITSSSYLPIKWVYTEGARTFWDMPSPPFVAALTTEDMNGDFWLWHAADRNVSELYAILGHKEFP